MISWISLKQITDTGVVSLSQALSELKLTSLSLDFNNVENITNTGVSILGQALAKLKELTSLSLSFCEVKNITDTGAVSLGRALGKLKKLTSIWLNFNDTKVTSAAEDQIKKACSFCKSVTCSSYSTNIF